MQTFRFLDILANQASKIWSENGKLRDLDKKFVCDKKEARSKLREAVRKHHAVENMKENNEKMNANFWDPKLFSKLVQKKRVNNQDYTTMPVLMEKNIKVMHRFCLDFLSTIMVTPAHPQSAQKMKIL